MTETEKKTIVRTPPELLPALPFVLATAILAGCLGVSLIRQHALSIFPPTLPVAGVDEARDWLAAVRAGDQRRAIYLASRMTAADDLVPRTPNPDYLEWFATHGLSASALTGPLGISDYRRWRDALMAADIVALAAVSTSSGVAAPEAIFAAITGRVKVTTDPLADGVAGDNQAVWTAGAGGLPDILRLLAVVWATGGYQVQVVAIHAKDGEILHLVCEVRQGAEVWVADAATGVCRAGADVAARLAMDDGVLPAGLCAEGAFLSFHLPAEPADYRLRQANLATVLERWLGDAAPRLGDDPRERIGRWRQTAPPPAQPYFTYWSYPLTASFADFMR